jgi:hypothetical protein
MKKLFISTVMMMSFLMTFETKAQDYAVDASNAIKPSPDQATFVFYRGGQFWRALVNFTIRANGEELCRLSNNRFMLYTAKPQKIVFTNVAGGLNIPDKEKLEIDAEAGKIYYIQCDIKSGFFADRMEMSEVTESTAKKKLKDVTADNCMKSKKE